MWFDAELVDDGIAQTTDLGAQFAAGIEENGFPLPDAIYTSPLARCLQTTKLVFKDVMLGHGREFKPTVKELLRERLTGHTCDRRRSKTWIRETYPEYEIEPTFEESDRLWSLEEIESNEEHVARKQTLLEDIFRSESGMLVALVTHSYAISAVLEAIGAEHFRVAESGMVALLVRAERV
jgi:broad specificity phosphatase PhoE